MRALYVTDCRSIGEDRWEALLRALRGADRLAVQLRERDTPDREVLRRARRARELLGSNVPLYVNRRFDIALAAGADGVHLPAAGLARERVVTNAPRGFHVGVSTHSAAQASLAIEQGADLIVIGPIFSTPSKQGPAPPLGPEELAKLPLAVDHPAGVYAIGGIDLTTIRQLAPWRDRITGVAAIRLFQEAPDPRAVLERVADA